MSRCPENGTSNYLRIEYTLRPKGLGVSGPDTLVLRVQEVHPSTRTPIRPGERRRETKGLGRMDPVSHNQRTTTTLLCGV